MTYTAYSVGQLMDDLDSNALKAERPYQDQYVELTGRLNVIDSDGNYISIVPQDDPYAIQGVQCYLQTEEQRQQVLLRRKAKGCRVMVDHLVHIGCV